MEPYQGQYINSQRQLQKFQEESSVKKSLLIIALLALGCSAAFGQSFSLGFLSNDGSTQYCDYEVVSVAKPYAAGTHNLTAVCLLPSDAAQVGFTTTIPASTGAPVTGAVVALADQVFDAEFQAFSGLQAVWVTKTKASSKKFGWSFYYDGAGNGTDYLGNYGYLTTTLGAKKGGKAVLSIHGK
jgi:hypothetical protein